MLEQDFSPDRVKKLIKATGVTLESLGTKHGFGPAAVSIALRKRSPFVQKMIADHLGMKPNEIWPSRYDENGSPIRLDPRGRQRISAQTDMAVKQKIVSP